MFIHVNEKVKHIKKDYSNVKLLIYTLVNYIESQLIILIVKKRTIVESRQKNALQCNGPYYSYVKSQY